MKTFLLAFLLLLENAATCLADDVPNIVFIFIDDMGYGDLSCFRNWGAQGWKADTIAHYPSTPHIDELAAQGLRLTNFYVASPICSPSRVGCTTGQFPSRHLINSYLNSRQRNHERNMVDFLSPQVPAIARVFKESGYATAHFGKWHQGGGRDVNDAPLPQAYGFDESLVSFEGLGDRILPPGGLSEQSAKLGQGTITRVAKHEQTRIYVDRSIEFINRHKESPFYLHLWLNDVHDGHQPAAGEAEQFADITDNLNEQKFFAVLVEMDKQIGRLIDHIDHQGLGEKTLILLTSDNGPTAWPRYYKQGQDPAGSTAGFRGRKWSLYEGGIRMPCILRWPGKIPSNRVNRELIFSTLDLFPTFAAIARINLETFVGDSPSQYFDGEDLSEALLNGEGQRTKTLFWEYGRDASYLRPGRKSDQSPNLALREQQWKLLMNDDGSRVELYNLSISDREVENIAEREPMLTNRLKQKLMNWRQSLPTLETVSPNKP